MDRLQVTVEAAVPDHDTGPAGKLPGEIDGTKWRVVYSVIEHFPAGSDPSVTLSLAYQDTPDIAAMSPPADEARTLPIPTARDVRVRLTPARDRPEQLLGHDRAAERDHSGLRHAQGGRERGGAVPGDPGAAARRLLAATRR